MPLPSISSPVEYPAFQLTQGYSFVTHYLILFLEWCLSKPCQSIHPSFLWMSLEFIIQCTVISLCVCVVIHKPKRLGVVIECVMSWSFLFKKKKLHCLGCLFSFVTLGLTTPTLLLIFLLDASTLLIILIHPYSFIFLL